MQELFMIIVFASHFRYIKKAAVSFLLALLLFSVCGCSSDTEKETVIPEQEEIQIPEERVPQIFCWPDALLCMLYKVFWFR